KTEIVKHKINTGNISSIKQHPYRMSSKYEKFIKEELNRLLQQGLIKVSYSSWTSPALVVGKANRKFRLVIDYHQLNKVTKPDAYPLSRIADIIDTLAH
ncbi:11784_t:CDS:1, partial [Scutellospora calospora]